jgi:hypothetical protein
MKNPEYLQACLAMLDTNSDGKIVKEEFLDRAQGMLEPGGTSQNPEPRVIKRTKMQGLGSG